MKSEMKFGTASLLLMLVGLCLIGLFAVAVAQSVLMRTVSDPQTRLLVGSALQAVFAFILPAMVCGLMARGTRQGLYGLDRKPGWHSILWIVCFYILSTPALEQIIWWNSEMHLPESMADLEATMRQWEDNAAVATEAMMSSTSVIGFICNILIIGVLTGFAEEIFFRGAIQGFMVRGGVRPGWAIFISAFVFSAIHFQFFGFVPRLLLGVLFGYIYYATGTIWASAFAHALNNSIVVTTMWLEARGICSIDFEQLLVSHGGFPLLFLLSALLSIAFVYKVKVVSKKNIAYHGSTQC